jgi:hypothetical protein
MENNVTDDSQLNAELSKLESRSMSEHIVRALSSAVSNPISNGFHHVKSILETVGQFSFKASGNRELDLVEFSFHDPTINPESPIVQKDKNILDALEDVMKMAVHHLVKSRFERDSIPD